MDREHRTDGIQGWWVMAGNFRLFCQTPESVLKWIAYIIAGGGVPQVEIRR